MIFLSGIPFFLFYEGLVYFCPYQLFLSFFCPFFFFLISAVWFLAFTYSYFQRK